MKIEINYDLIEKIQQAKGEAKLKRYYKQAAQWSIPYISFTAILYPIIGLAANESIQEIVSQTILRSMIYYGAGLFSMPLHELILTKITKETPQQKAEKELTDLSLKLNSQFVKTSLPLLLDSKQYHKEHKLVLSKKGLPCIMQNKYIMIPTYDDGDIKETSILQEHKIGSKEYVLSLGSPTQVKQFKPAYGF